ncbi:MAG: hypothetical protein WA393_13595 [Nitrososphaeraceae archaeon]
MKKSTKLVALGAALILSGILVAGISPSSQASAQGIISRCREIEANFE